MKAGQCYPTNWVSVSLSPLSSNTATTGSTFSLGYKKAQTLTATQLHHFCFFYYPLSQLLFNHNYFIRCKKHYFVIWRCHCLFVCLFVNNNKNKTNRCHDVCKKYERSLSTLPKERSCERRASRIATQPCVLTSWCFSTETKLKKRKRINSVNN